MDQFVNKHACDGQGVDTAIHAYITHNPKLLDNVKIIESPTALISHMPYWGKDDEMRKKGKFDFSGHLLNKYGKPYHMIHQLNRLELLWLPYVTTYEKSHEYSWLSSRIKVSNGILIVVCFFATIGVLLIFQLYLRDFVFTTKI